MAAELKLLAARSAVVTGGSRGIGYAVARALVAEGAEVMLVARGQDALWRSAGELRCRYTAADVATESGVQQVQRECAAAWMRAPDILVNAAGAFELALVHETSVESFERQIGANLRAPFLLVRAFLAEWLERGSGHVVSIGSISGRRGFPANGAYAASKFGIRGLHAVLAEELRGTGVRSTLLEPAATDTPLWDTIDREKHPGLPPAEAMLDAEAVASAVLFAVTRPAGIGVPNLIMERS